MSPALWRTLVDLVLAGRCVGCDAPHGDVLCPACRASILQAPPAHRAVVGDEGPAARLVRFGKDRGVRRAAGVMAQITVARHGRGQVRLPSGALLVSWVPPEPRRTAQRGYHLPEQYARKLGRLLDIPARPLLARAPSRAQRGSSRAERQRNIRGVFSLLSSAQPPPEHVLLLDDLVATGSTLNECARCLTNAFDTAITPLAFAARD